MSEPNEAWARRYRGATEPSPEALGRVRRGAMSPAVHRPARAGWVVAAVGGLAAAALWAVVAMRPTPVDAELVRGGAPLDLGDKVVVRSDGAGHAIGTSRALELAWREGRIDVAVTPKAGVQLAVRTDEATVRVVGTEFSVERDVLGTHVGVSRGRVEVDCAVGGPRAVSAGEAVSCLPRTAAGMLGRVRAKQAGGAAPADLLDEVEQALGWPDVDADTRGELVAVAVEAQLGAGRTEAAYARAVDGVALDGARTEEFLRVAARLAPGCAEALPWLRQLQARGALGEDARAFSSCSGEPSTPPVASPIMEPR